MSGIKATPLLDPVRKELRDRVAAIDVCTHGAHDPKYCQCCTEICAQLMIEEARRQTNSIRNTLKIFLNSKLYTLPAPRWFSKLCAEVGLVVKSNGEAATPEEAALLARMSQP